MSKSPQHIPLPVSPVAGVKRPAPSLLPAFEPFFSSPQLPRPNKRFAHASPSKTSNSRERSYPTPIPSSSTIIPSSSSPPKAPYTRRAALTRTLSTVSERAPLSIVPTLELSEHGEPTLMGRSSNSSHYQLSTNKLISRVHVKATYLAGTPPDKRKVQVECVGWNGVRVHCTGRTHDLERGQVFTSEVQDADIMVDVQDARVLLAWPKHESKVVTPTDSENSWGSPDNTPIRAAAAAAARNHAPATSPLRQQRLQSPISPSPAVNATHAQPSGHFASDPPVPVPVQIYEDEAEEEDAEGSQKATQSTQFASQLQGNILQELPVTQTHDFESDNDEENDPIISSFSGPYGANLTANMESFTTRASPRRQPLHQLKEESISPQRVDRAGVSPKRRRRDGDQDVSSFHSSFNNEEETNPITSHIISQLAYSRLSSTPLSTLMQNLPSNLKIDLDSDLLISLLDGSPCVGEVAREGKDAAGKHLESEYYYIPEGDSDKGRREMVEATGLGGRGLRNCRKSHKQYYWRKPK